MTTAARTPTGMVNALSAIVWLVVVGLLLIVPDPFEAAVSAPAWLTVIVAVMFGLSEYFVFVIPHRRESQTFSAAEIPTALALAVVSPVLAVALRAIAAVATIRVAWGSSWQKLTIDGAVCSLEVIVSFVLVRFIVGTSVGDPVDLVIAAACSVWVARSFGAVIAAAATTMFEGHLRRLPSYTARTIFLIVPIASVSGAVAMSPSLVEPALGLIAIAPLVGTWVLARAYRNLRRQQRDLLDTHGFSSTIGTSLSIDDVVRTAAIESSRLVRTSRSTVVIRLGDIDYRYDHGSGAYRDQIDLRAEPWAAFVATSEPKFLTFEDGQPAIDTTRRPTALIAPIGECGNPFGALILAEPTGARPYFDQTDLDRAGILTEQLDGVMRRAHLHEAAQYAANHDSVTGLPNRHAFEQRIDKLIGDELGNDDLCAAVAVLDLNRFKEVNEILGHAVGDEVLTKVGETLQQQLEQGEFVARLSGDEFALLIRRSSLADVVEVAEQIESNSFHPLTVAGLDIVTTVNVGLAVVDPNCDATELLRRADIAMYSAKHSHLGCQLYDPAIDRRTPDRLAVVGVLRRALDEHRLDVMFQPTVNLASSTVVGAEALVRWNDGPAGYLSPAEVIRLSEESGLIRQLTDQVLATSISTASEWKSRGWELSISVNLSAHDLLDERLADRVAVHLDKNQMPPDQLILEITESALLVDTPRTRHTIGKLSELGVSLALDDFGTGYSSLGYLRRLPVSQLKVDASFVQRMLSDDQDEVIVRSTIELGHSLGLLVVAEGIENQHTYDRLRSLGCDIGQGFYVKRPAPASEIAEWLASGKYHVAGGE